MSEPLRFHAHVYFDRATRVSAAALREALREMFVGRVNVHGLIDVPVGPHPRPMFEVDLPAAHLGAVRAWLFAHHGVHSVLIHPVTGDDLADHRDSARWIGEPLPLDLAFLKSVSR